MSNFEELQLILAGIKNSENPTERLMYLKCLKELLTIGRWLDRLAPGNEELRKNLAGLREKIENYSLYPKIKNHESGAF